MTVAEYQKRLNQDIARELDKYQVMLEYGRMLLDKDKRIRRSYKWISLSKKKLHKWSCIGLYRFVYNGYIFIRNIRQALSFHASTSIIISFYLCCHSL